MEIRRYPPDDLPGILRLCEAEHWPSFPQDPPRANRALTAPGVTTMVAIDDDRVIGFAQMQSDGEVQAHLSLMAVDNDYRGRGIARQLIGVALLQAGGQAHRFTHRQRGGLLQQAATQANVRLPTLSE
jgi:ribosomal protein S18 acetylase RimI-like enzyme